MRKVLVSLMLVLALAGSSLAQQQCKARLDDDPAWDREGFTISIPLKITAKVLGKIAGLVVFSISFETAILNYTLCCVCTPYPPCCPTHVRANLYSTLHLRGDESELPDLVDQVNPFYQHRVVAVLIPNEERWTKCWKDDKAGACHKKHIQSGIKFHGTLSMRIQVGIDPIRFSPVPLSEFIRVQSSKVCWCSDREGCQRVEECERNQAPTLHGPHMFTVPKGESSELVLTATDPDGPADITVFRIREYPQKMSVDPKEIKEVVPQTGDTKPKAKQATFILSLPTDAFLPPAHDDHLEVEVVDKCRNKAVLKIPIFSEAAPPVLQLISIERDRGRYKFKFRITDEDRRERFLVYVDVIGGKVVAAPRAFNCYSPEDWTTWDKPCDTTFNVLFEPQEVASERKVTVTVTDRYGLKASVSWSNPNRPPCVTVSPTKIKTAPGQKGEAIVKAVDPALTLRKVFGPGGFSTVTGKGAVQGNYKWTVPNPYQGSPWVLVGFKAEDLYRASGFAYLSIHIPQPPKVYGALAWVPRAGTSETFIWVFDPDSPSHTFSFRPPRGISVELGKKKASRDIGQRWASFYYTVKVSADRSLCPGTYFVPFTVTDPDGNTTSATLTVHVWVNQPP